MNEEKPPLSLMEHQLEEMRKEGLPIHKGVKTFHSQSPLSGPNKQILARWLPQWCLQAAQNYPVVSKAWGLRALRSSCKGLPAIVVGIGPSLDREVELLGQAQQNAIIIATDAALRPLAARGIRPHLVVTFDCKAEQFTLFDGVDTSGMVLLANSCSHPNIAKAWKGKLLFYNMQHQGLEFTDVFLPCLYPGLGSLANHGTVGNGAVLLAYQMGCSVVLTVGMDLCYQKAGDGVYRYRCQDFEWAEQRSDKGLPARWIPKENKLLYDNDQRLRDAFDVEIKGKKFRVDPELDMYRRILVDVAGSFDGVSVIDCSEGGVLGAAGFPTKRLKDALVEHCSRVIEPGESVVPHLPLIIPEIKGGN